mmetsp:Transcript_38733/g.91073  ORF Transcript_38733/g.91073 Transcript_38733/m.91073 type:complete len:336 (-) Transcript_38733:570-1577(-)
MRLLRLLVLVVCRRVRARGVPRDTARLVAGAGACRETGGRAGHGHGRGLVEVVIEVDDGGVSVTARRHHGTPPACSTPIVARLGVQHPDLLERLRPLAVWPLVPLILRDVLGAPLMHPAHPAVRQLLIRRRRTRERLLRPTAPQAALRRWLCAGRAAVRRRVFCWHQVLHALVLLQPVTVHVGLAAAWDGAGKGPRRRRRVQGVVAVAPGARAGGLRLLSTGHDSLRDVIGCAVGPQSEGVRRGLQLRRRRMRVVAWRRPARLVRRGSAVGQQGLVRRGGRWRHGPRRPAARPLGGPTSRAHPGQRAVAQSTAGVRLLRRRATARRLAMRGSSPR